MIQGLGKLHFQDSLDEGESGSDSESSITLFLFSLRLGEAIITPLNHAPNKTHIDLIDTVPSLTAQSKAVQWGVDTRNGDSTSP